MNSTVNISNLSEDDGKGHIIIRSKDEIINRKLFLKNKAIGISISESDNLNELGYGVIHIKDAMIELARYVLAFGGKLVYGGDMRAGGFTELFFDLLAYYKSDSSELLHTRFISYLAWPLSLKLTKEQQADLSHNVTFVKVDPPADLNISDKNSFLQPNSPENLFRWARCLSKMRTEMDADCAARIFIGGRASSFKGKMPGLIEELLISIKNKKPIYLIGAFGGVIQDAISSLDNKMTNSFKDEYYKGNAEYASLVTIYNQEQKEDQINYAQYFEEIRNIGFKGLGDLNGLSEEDNRRLAATPHIHEIIHLVLKGLKNKFTS